MRWTVYTAGERSRARRDRRLLTDPCSRLRRASPRREGTGSACGAPQRPTSTPPFTRDLLSLCVCPYRVPGSTVRAVCRCAVSRRADHARRPPSLSAQWCVCVESIDRKKREVFCCARTHRVGADATPAPPCGGPGIRDRPAGHAGRRRRPRLRTRRRGLSGRGGLDQGSVPHRREPPRIDRVRVAGPRIHLRILRYAIVPSLRLDPLPYLI
jgi:hypothetical protein